MPRLFFVFILTALVLTGCGPGERPFTDNSKDPESYARDVKQIALGAIAQAKRSREPADQIQVLVAELEGQEATQRPLGTYKPLYDELLALAKPLLADCKKGKPSNLTDRLDALKRVAEKLPGEVQKRD